MPRREFGGNWGKKEEEGGKKAEHANNEGEKSQNLGEKGIETAPSEKEPIPPPPRKKKRRIPVKNMGDIVFPDLPPLPIRSKQLSVKQIMAKMKEIRMGGEKSDRQLKLSV